MVEDIFLERLEREEDLIEKLVIKENCYLMMMNLQQQLKEEN